MMNRWRRGIILGSLFSFLLANGFGCAPAVVVTAPPAPRMETRPAKPHATAVWIDGHWKWNSSKKDFVWVSGHWAKEKPGKTWVKGHWQKTPGGWKWVDGHWR